MDELKKSYRVSVIIGIAMMASLFIYAAGVEFVKIKFDPFEGFSPFPEVEILRYIFLAIAVGEFFFIKYFKNISLSKKIIPFQGVSISNPIQKFITASIVVYALCESVAIYGFVLFLIAGSSMDFYTFMILSLVYLVIYFPRYTQWEEWAKKEYQSGNS